jgi:hypothetical protein
MTLAETGFPSVICVLSKGDAPCCRRKTEAVVAPDIAMRNKGKEKALCGNRRPSNDCLPYENLDPAPA